MNGPFAITVLPDALLVEGRGLAKPESSATELAILLHQQLIGEMTLFDRLDNDGWHAFLSLLAGFFAIARRLGLPRRIGARHGPAENRRAVVRSLEKSGGARPPTSRGCARRRPNRGR